MSSTFATHPARHIVALPRYDRSVSAASPDIARALDRAFATGTADLRAAYDAHGSLVYGICRKALGPEAAKDVTQEVFVSAWRARERFDPSKGTLAGWLVGIAKRRVIDHLRSERRHADRRADELTDAPDHTEHVDRIADRSLVVDALRQLPDRQREIIQLAYVHDLTHHDIAERTGIPLGTVKSDIRRGLIRIRDLMESTNG